jgi:hypothetical protein
LPDLCDTGGRYAHDDGIVARQRDVDHHYLDECDKRLNHALHHWAAMVNVWLPRGIPDAANPALAGPKCVRVWRGSADTRLVEMFAVPL